jgi:hypothetical protein
MKANNTPTDKTAPTSAPTNDRLTAYRAEGAKKSAELIAALNAANLNLSRLYHNAEWLSQNAAYCENAEDARLAGLAAELIDKGQDYIQYAISEGLKGKVL